MCVCVHFCYTGEFNIEEIGQGELEEDSTVESDREEDINHDGLVAEVLNRLPSTMSSNIQSTSDPRNGGGYFHTEGLWLSEVKR